MNWAPGALRRTPRSPARRPSQKLDDRLPIRVSGSRRDPRGEAPSSTARPAGATSDPAAPRVARDDQHPTPRKAGLVLVVDDNVGFRGLAARILGSWGYEVIEAGSVVDAVRCVVERRPHTVIVDIGLPDGDGFGLTEQLVALPSPPRVVLISTDADAGNRSAAQRSGAAGFLPKDELLSGALQRLIDP